MKLVYSPSSLKTFMQCPYKFKAMYVDRSVKFKQGDAAKRGEHLHEMMQARCQAGWDILPWDDELSRPHAEGFIKTVTRLKETGWDIRTEYPLGVDASGSYALDFFDQSADLFMRCRIDFVATHKKSDTALILDWKTGKKYETDKLQLQVNAVCMKAATGIRKYNVGFCYLDSGDFVSEHIELPENVLLRDLGKACPEMSEALTQAEHALWKNEFKPTPNRFCHWCAVTGCPRAGK